MYFEALCTSVCSDNVDEVMQLAKIFINNFKSITLDLTVVYIL